MRQAVRVLAVLGLAIPLVIGAATRVPAAVTITYGVVSWNPFHWVVMVGIAKGQFEKHGVKLDIPMTGSSGAAVQALIGGSLHMTTTSPGAAFLAQDKAPDMKQIIGIYDTSRLDRKRRSVHYKTMPTVTNVQVDWAVKERWI